MGAMTSTPTPGPADIAPTARSARFGTALAVAITSGAVIAVQGKLNGELATRGAGALVSSWFAYVGAFVMAVLLLAALGRLGPAMRALRHARWWWFAVGLCSVPLVMSMAVGIPVVGVALASVCSVAGQTVSGLVLDSRGVGLDAPIRLTVRRAVAGLGALLGLVVAVLSSPGPSSGTVLAAVGTGLFLFVGGLLLSVQSAGNGVVAARTGDPLVPTVASVVGGLLGITVVCAVALAVGGLSEVSLPPLSTDWWVYLGGPLGAIITVSAAYSVRTLGTFALTLSIVGGQLVMALVLDIGGGVGASWSTIVSVLIIAASVSLTVTRSRSAGQESTTA